MKNSRLILVLCLQALAACSTARPVQAPASTTAQPAQYAYVVVPSASPSSAGPQILEVSLLSRDYTAPGPVAVRVRTSPDVTTVTATLMGREVGVPRIGDGTFEMHQQLPDIPFFLKGRDYTVKFVAATTDGRKTEANIAVHLNR